MTFPPLLAWSLAAVLAIAFATLGRGVLRRLTAAALPLLLVALAHPPHRPGRAVSTAMLPDSASRGTVEAVVASVTLGGTIEVTGDGLHPDYWPLLAGRRVAWQSPAPRQGVVALAWPRRALVGEPFRIRGALGGADSQTVHLVGPAGERDSLRTDSAFAFVVIPRAAGRWHWTLAVGGRGADTLAVAVRDPPHLVVAIIAAQPDFALPSLARRLERQGASVTVRTRLTATLWRTERFGPAAPDDPLTTMALGTLDLLVLGDGAEGALGTDTRARVRAAVEQGLGLVQLLGGKRPPSDLMPFRLRALGGAAGRVIAVVDGIPARIAVPAAALRIEGGTPLVNDSSGAVLASVLTVGKGRIVASRLPTPSQWTLAGEPDAEARWWAALGGATLRQPAGRWEVSDSALVRLDAPLRLRWVGDTAGATVLHEGTARDWVTWSTVDSLGGEVILWPREEGWMTIARQADSLQLWVGGAAALSGVERAVRHRAAAAALTAPLVPGPPAAPESVPWPRWPFAVALLGAGTVLWRKPH